MANGRIPCIIAIKPWFQDHALGDKIVLPAVEAMLQLAAHVAATYPEINIKVMEDACFAKFLEIAPDAASLSTLLECSGHPDGRVQAKLLSKSQFKAMSRIKEHCEIFFSRAATDSTKNSPKIHFASVPPAASKTKIKVDYLYRELVPFGPNYRTLQEAVYLTEHEAWGRLRAPRFPLFPVDPIQKILGSPFPLDGALHAACVLGQQAVDFVPFPVGFRRRTVLRPTQSGSSYITRVRQTSRSDDELIFDVAIWDDGGQLYEIVDGLRMRDVSSVLKKNRLLAVVGPGEQLLHGNPGQPAQNDKRIDCPGQIHAKEKNHMRQDIG